MGKNSGLLLALPKRDSDRKKKALPNLRSQVSPGGTLKNSGDSSYERKGGKRVGESIRQEVLKERNGIQRKATQTSSLL